MSNDRNRPENDPLVTKTYRELANERTPDHLTERVLRMAAANKRGRYFMTRAWMRSVAWAATIGLSLALVMELTRTPQIALDSADLSSPASTVAEHPEITAEAFPPLPVIAGREGEVGVEAEDNAEAGASPPAATVSSPAEVPRERYDSVQNDDFAPQGMDVLDQATKIARSQAGPDQAPALPGTPTGEAMTEDLAIDEPAIDRRSSEQPNVQGRISDAPSPDRLAVVDRRIEETSQLAAQAGFSMSEKAKSDPACPASTRENPESWFDCIEDLREAGQVDLAKRENEEFRRIFPDFSAAQADK